MRSPRELARVGPARMLLAHNMHPLHLEHPEWRNIFDLDESAAVQSRQRLFDRAAAGKWLTLAYHFPFPGLGRVEKRSGAWKWTAES